MPREAEGHGRSCPGGRAGTGDPGHGHSSGRRWGSGTDKMAAGQLRPGPRPRHGHAPTDRPRPWASTVRCAAPLPRPLHTDRALCSTHSIQAAPPSGHAPRTALALPPVSPLSSHTPITLDTPHNCLDTPPTPPRLILSASPLSRHAPFLSDHASNPTPATVQLFNPAHTSRPRPSGRLITPRACPAPPLQKSHAYSKYSSAHSSQTPPTRPSGGMQAQEGDPAPLIPWDGKNKQLQTHERKPQSWECLEQTLSI